MCWARWLVSRKEKLAQQRWLSALEEAKIWNVPFDQAEAQRRLGNSASVESMLNELATPYPILWEESLTVAQPNVAKPASHKFGILPHT